ncbi:hypothetical protein FHL15_007168 [Xylaria flabelliformis]|uniref:Gfd2/YDR514C-like C-terminal domain-containing protein n=1 Tax=Xylaria flabelliformis TaxID=2512241 RepID=A0A553HV78_9PEZI|nr:hypothetical protein FHL15_007168 [Xylaria flabelliformis]
MFRYIDFYTLYRYLARSFSFLSTIFAARSKDSNNKLLPIKSPDQRIAHNDSRADIKKLIKLWQHPKNPQVLFAALQVHTIGSSDARVTGVGFSTWLLDNSFHIESCYWDIDEKNGLEQSSSLTNSSDFRFGRTGYLNCHEIGPVLTTMLDNLKTAHDIIYLVGYDIQRCIDILEDDNMRLNNMERFDVLGIWQFVKGIIEPASLKDIVRSIPDLAGSVELLGNAGNESHVIIQLLKILARKLVS